MASSWYCGSKPASASPLSKTWTMKAPMRLPTTTSAAAEQAGAADHHCGDGLEVGVAPLFGSPPPTRPMRIHAATAKASPATM